MKRMKACTTNSVRYSPFGVTLSNEIIEKIASHITISDDYCNRIEEVDIELHQIDEHFNVEEILRIQYSVSYEIEREYDPCPCWELSDWSFSLLDAQIWLREEQEPIPLIPATYSKLEYLISKYNDPL